MGMQLGTCCEAAVAARSGGGLDRRGRRRSFLAGSFSVLTVPPRNGWRRSGSPAVRSGWGCRRVSRGGREAKVRGEAAAGIGRKPHPARSNGGTKVNEYFARALARPWSL